MSTDNSNNSALDSLRSSKRKRSEICTEIACEIKGLLRIL